MNIPRQTISAAALIFVFFLRASAEGPFVIIDSLAGKAEVQRAGKSSWQLVKEKDRLENNDMLRVLEKSHATLKWSNGSVMYVHQQSQVLINLHYDTRNDLLSRHVTIFFGAMFFIVKKTLPRKFVTQHDTKVYSPTAVLSIRGTAFAVNVKKDNGHTDVRVLKGTVLVGNILKKESIFLTAGFRTQVQLNADPLAPKGIMENEIKEIETWAPPPVVRDQMVRQTAQARKDHYTIVGKYEDKLLVAPLVNASSYNGKWNISDAITMWLEKRIAQNSGMETAIAGKDSLDIIAAGEKAKSRFALTGEIKSFDIVQKAVITATADKYQEFYTAKVRLHLQLIDIANRKLLLASDIEGEVSGKNVEANSWQHIGAKAFDMADTTFSKTILARAINQSLENSASLITRYVKEN
jgi:TolB-like protein